jgi:pectate lyase
MKKILSAFALSACAATAFATTTVTGTFDGGGRSYGTSCGGQAEGQQPVFLLKDGATIKNVVINSNAADGVHCEGSCTISNVVWQDVCEDAVTMMGGSGKTMNINGGSAASASDKVIQHNGKGSTINISNFATYGSIGKLYRSCGDCSSNGGPRRVNISNTRVEKATAGVVGINSNYGDVATIRSLKIKGYKAGSPQVCVTYKGVNKGSGSSTKIGEEWNTAACNVSRSDVSSY